MHESIVSILLWLKELDWVLINKLSGHVVGKSSEPAMIGVREGLIGIDLGPIFKEEIMLENGWRLSNSHYSKI